MKESLTEEPPQRSTDMDEGSNNSTDLLAKARTKKVTKVGDYGGGGDGDGGALIDECGGEGHRSCAAEWTLVNRFKHAMISTYKHSKVEKNRAHTRTRE